MGWELHREWKGMTAGHGKEQQEGFLNADNRSEVTKLGRLPTGWSVREADALSLQWHSKVVKKSHVDETLPENSLHQTLNFTVTCKTNSPPAVVMVIIWLRSWFPVESGFCLAQRGTDSRLKWDEKWQPSQLSYLPVSHMDWDTSCSWHGVFAEV